MPRLYMETNCGGALNVLEAMRSHAPDAHMVQASTSEMFGNEGGSELSPMNPVSPYGVSKLAAHHLCRIYRKSYRMRVSCAISFNHESPRRPPIFVSRKVTQAAARIRAGLQGSVTLGNLDVWRDWGYAKDYMEAYMLMAEANRPDDYVVATGISHSLSELVQIAFQAAGIEGERVISEPGDRPTDVYSLCGDPRKIERKLGWRAKTSIEDLIRMMVGHDLEEAMVRV
jgi:GDPmannose 4,6-dehydratase